VRHTVLPGGRGEPAVEPATSGRAPCAGGDPSLPDGSA
jgi:hypothetical protein